MESSKRIKDRIYDYHITSLIDAIKDGKIEVENKNKYTIMPNEKTAKIRLSSEFGLELMENKEFTINVEFYVYDMVKSGWLKTRFDYYGIDVEISRDKNTFYVKPFISNQQRKIMDKKSII